MRFSPGDKVIVIYTGREYCAGIRVSEVERIKSKNPCTISYIAHHGQRAQSTRYRLQEDNGRYYWPPDLLRPATVEIVWEV